MPRGRPPKPVVAGSAPAAAKTTASSGKRGRPAGSVGGRFDVAPKRSKHAFLNPPELPKLGGSDAPVTFVFSTGTNTAGELGVNPEDTPERPKPGPIKVLNDQHIVRLCVGGMHTVAITSEGKCYSWGCNDEKALGRLTAEFQPELVNGLEGVRIVQALCCDSATFVLSDDGRVYACGTLRDENGPVGLIPGSVFQESFIRVPGLHEYRIVKLGGGANFCMLVTDDGKLLTIGTSAQLMEDIPNPLGRRILRGKERSLRPQVVSMPSHMLVQDVFCGGYSTLAIVKDINSNKNHVLAWGLNRDGQLGIDARNVEEPTIVPGLENKKVKQIAMGTFHSLILLEDGSVYSMGMGDDGQLGHPTTEQVKEPKKIEGLKDPVRFINCGTRHSLAITTKGELFVWGNNASVQLGLEDDDDRKTPEHVQTKNREVYDVGGGSQFSIILASDKHEE